MSDCASSIRMGQRSGAIVGGEIPNDKKGDVASDGGDMAGHTLCAEHAFREAMIASRRRECIRLAKGHEAPSNGSALR